MITNNKGGNEISFKDYFYSLKDCWIEEYQRFQKLKDVQTLTRCFYVFTILRDAFTYKLSI